MKAELVILFVLNSWMDNPQAGYILENNPETNFPGSKVIPRSRRSIAVLIFAEDEQSQNRLPQPTTRRATSEYSDNHGYPMPYDHDPEPTLPSQESTLTPPSHTHHVQVQPCPVTTPEVNKKMGVKMFQEVVGNSDTRYMDNYFSASYIQHSPDVADGIEPLRELVMKGALSGRKPAAIDFQRVSAEGDLVWIHTRRNFTGKVFSRVDILRFECGKIAEHWDIMQDTELKNPAPNNHPFF